MNIHKQTEIKNRLSVLMGTELRKLSRVGGMVCLSFGDTVERELPALDKGKTGEWVKESCYQYALHLQTPFRILCGDRLILGQSDIYQPKDADLSKPDFDWDSFDYDVCGNNRFDEITAGLNCEMNNGFKVAGLVVKRTGDIGICFENRLKLETFIDLSATEECWRFFEPGNEDSHIAVGACGIVHIES